MRTVVYVIVLLAIANSGCKKENVPAGRKFAAMHGTWIGIGETYESLSPSPPDAFFEFRVSVLNDVVIKIGNQILPFDEKHSNKDTSFFRSEEYGSNSSSFTQIAYCERTRNITYSHEGSNRYVLYSTEISTGLYRPNLMVKLYTQRAAGIKHFRGTMHRTERYTNPKLDTTYELEHQFIFTVVNDSTIALDSSVAVTTDYELHYKYTDIAAGTITYETFHNDYYILSLVYDYVHGKFIYKERKSDIDGDINLEMHSQ